MICRAAEREGAGRLREEPVEADHHTDPRARVLEDAKPGVAGQKQQLLTGEKVRLSIDLEHAGRADCRRRIVQPLGRSLRESGHDDPARPARQALEHRQEWPGAVARLAEGIKASGDAYR